MHFSYDLKLFKSFFSMAIYTVHNGCTIIYLPVAKKISVYFYLEIMSSIFQNGFVVEGQLDLRTNRFEVHIDCEKKLPVISIFKFSLLPTI